MKSKHVTQVSAQSVTNVPARSPPQPSPPEGEREMRTDCWARAINRSLLTEFAAIRRFKARNFISAKSLPEGEGRGEGEATVETRQSTKIEMLSVHVFTEIIWNGAFLDVGSWMLAVPDYSSNS